MVEIVGRRGRACQLCLGKLVRRATGVVQNTNAPAKVPERLMTVVRSTRITSKLTFRSIHSQGLYGWEHQIRVRRLRVTSWAGCEQFQFQRTQWLKACRPPKSRFMPVRPVSDRLRSPRPWWLTQVDATWHREPPLEPLPPCSILSVCCRV